MKIFIVEDDENRITKFKDKFAHIEEAQLYITRTASEAKKVLDENKDVMWDLMLLDHDLGGRVYVESADQNTGYQVAKHIKEKGIKYYNAITHSLNPVGADNIMGQLENCNHIPFTLLKDMDFDY